MSVTQIAEFTADGALVRVMATDELAAMTTGYDLPVIHGVVSRQSGETLIALAPEHASERQARRLLEHLPAGVDLLLWQYPDRFWTVTS
ncbi:hypothetical protein [Frankia sp. CiP3]|uniref:hypothetical protein n=1 Tax=Frankia sp. CiP3 TaxID=2880971 RepID=UPI001EF715C5|nr:hypothetical protein [Frankia sp. CiP3]